MFKKHLIIKAISRCESEVKRLNAIIHDTPGSKLCELYKKTNEAVKPLLSEPAQNARLLNKILAEAILEEERLKAILEQQRNTDKLIDQLVKVESELSGLRNELFLIKQEEAAYEKQSNL